MSSSDGNNCTYTGTLSADGLSVTGLQVCTREPGTQCTWSATIAGGAPPAAAAAMVWTVNDAGTRTPPQYHFGDVITICFSTLSVGAAVLTDIFSDGSTLDYYDYGGNATSTCLDVDTVIEPLGQECM